MANIERDNAMRKQTTMQRVQVIRRDNKGHMLQEQDRIYGEGEL